MFTITFNDAAAIEAILRLESRLGDMTGAMQDIGEYLVKATQDRMLRGLSPDGTPFAPRSQTTLDEYARRKKKPGPVPLWLTAAMRETIHYRAAPDHVSIASNSVQAAVMQFGAAQGAFGATRRGGAIPWGTIPARPFLGVSDTDRSAILDILAEWLEEGAAGGAAAADRA